MKLFCYSIFFMLNACGAVYAAGLVGVRESLYQKCAKFIAQDTKPNGLMEQVMSFPPHVIAVPLAEYISPILIDRGLPRSCLHELTGHGGCVTVAAWSPDGEGIASAAQDGLIYIWESKTGLKKYRLQGHTVPVDRLRYSLDGKTLVSTSKDGLVQVWDLDTGTSKYAGLQAQTSRISVLKIDSLFTKMATTAETDTNISVWDLQKGKLQHRLMHSGNPSAIDLSSDGSKVISAAGKTVYVWDCNTGHQVASFDFGSDTASAVAFNPDASMIAIGSGSYIYVRDCLFERIFQVLESPRIFKKVEFDCDNTKVIGSFGKAYFLRNRYTWDLKTGNLIAKDYDQLSEEYAGLCRTTFSRVRMQGKYGTLRLTTDHIDALSFMNCTRETDFQKLLYCAAKAWHKGKVYTVNPLCPASQTVVDWIKKLMPSGSVNKTLRIFFNQSDKVPVFSAQATSLGSERKRRERDNDSVSDVSAKEQRREVVHLSGFEQELGDDPLWDAALPF